MSLEDQKTPIIFSDLIFYIKKFHARFDNLFLSWHCDYEVCRNYPSESEVLHPSNQTRITPGKKIVSRFAALIILFHKKRPVLKYSIFMYSMWKRSPGFRCRTWRVREKLPRATWITRVSHPYSKGRWITRFQISCENLNKTKIRRATAGWRVKLACINKTNEMECSP